MIIDRKNIITKEELETNLKEANIKIREAYLMDIVWSEVFLTI